MEGDRRPGRRHRPDHLEPVRHEERRVYDVIRSASAQPEVGRLLTDNRRRRRADRRQLVGALVATGQLRPDLDADHAADVVFGLVNEDVYLLLTVDCEWSRKRFTRWLGEPLLDQLVAAPGALRVGRRPRRAS